MVSSQSPTAANGRHLHPLSPEADIWLWGSHVRREADMIPSAHATIWRRLRFVRGLVPRFAATASTMLRRLRRPTRSLELAGPHSPQGLPMKSIGGAIVTMSPALPAASDMFGTTMLPSCQRPATCSAPRYRLRCQRSAILRRLQWMEVHPVPRLPSPSAPSASSRAQRCDPQQPQGGTLPVHPST